MIKTFRDKDTETLFDDSLVRRFKSFERPARRKVISWNINNRKVFKKIVIPE